MFFLLTTKRSAIIEAVITQKLQHEEPVHLKSTDFREFITIGFDPIQFDSIQFNSTPHITVQFYPKLHNSISSNSIQVDKI